MKKLIVGNWKMNPETMAQARSLVLNVEHRMHLVQHSIEVVVCPPSIYFAPFYHHTHFIKLGAQNVCWAEEGAYTGEISAKQLQQWGINYVILGHSERRMYFGEDDQSVNEKIKVALKNKIQPIVCLGGEVGAKKINMGTIVTRQFVAALKGLTREQVGKIVFAYEPIWAISTMKNSKPATGEHAAELIEHIYGLLRRKVGKEKASHMKVLYGGTVNSKNVSEYAKFPVIGGALVGSASLNSENFWEIMKEFSRESIHKK